MAWLILLLHKRVCGSACDREVKLGGGGMQSPDKWRFERGTMSQVIDLTRSRQHQPITHSFMADALWRRTSVIVSVNLLSSLHNESEWNRPPEVEIESSQQIRLL